MADESSCGEASVKVPKTESVIPRSRKGIHAIRRNGNVRNKVIVPVKDAFWCAVAAFFVPGELPDNDGFI